MLKIGWSKKDVSTELPVFIPGQFEIRISKGVMDPVILTALTIDSDGEYVIFLSCDLVGVNAGVLDAIRDKVKSLNPEIDPTKIVMHVTHAHSTPLVSMEDKTMWGYAEDFDGVDIAGPEQYRDFFINSAADAVVESFNSKQEGKIAYGYGYAVVGHSRRPVYFNDRRKLGTGQANSRIVDGFASLYGSTSLDDFSHFETGPDHFANFLYTFDKDDKLTGAIANIPCPSQNAAREWTLSSDYWHNVRCLLKEKYGDIYLLPQCAPAGDMAPEILHYFKAQDRRLRLKYPDFKFDERTIRPKHMIFRQEIAERICAAFDDVYSWASKEKISEAPLMHTVKTVKLQKRLISEEDFELNMNMYAKHKEESQYKTDGTPEENMKHNALINATNSRYEGVIKRYEEQKENPLHEMELHVIRLGDIAFATNQYELFIDYMHRIQGRSPFTQTFCIQLVAQPNNTPGGSYLATERAAHNVGYSATMYCNRISPEGGQQLVEETVKELKKLYEE